MNTFLHASLTVAIALALAGHSSPTSAQASAPSATVDADKSLAEARAELARAARKVAELSHDRAVPAARAAHRIASRPVLGVLLAPDEGNGVRVAGVTPDGGAAKAGIKSGDRIVSVDGRQVLGGSGELRAQNLRTLLGKLDSGKKTRIGYVRDGRAATVDVTPSAGRNLVVFSPGDAASGDFDFDFDFPDMRAIASDVRREIIRIGPGIACKGNDCDMPALMSAFRWNGLNLASMDKQLGRYFGTDHGVLVLSNGELSGLQAGDVIQRIDGKAVASPREAMAAMGNKPGGTKVAVDYLRDRKPGKAQVTVPKLAPLPLPPAPPAPPAPPTAPKAPPPPPVPSAPQAMAPVVPPAPPTAPLPPAVPDGAGTFTFIADDGRSVSFAWQANDATSVDTD
ncbi:PDZ domain-containing protein [Luteimonas sp. 22616]|uniref:PDZ domain-containing protein n=1 Tax=Luteimonas sp. 22616 TaxID=3453951 RepID=UPI003F82CF20